MPEIGMKPLDWDDIVPGQELASQLYLISPEDLRDQAEACEDYNPIYSEPEFGVKSDIGSIVAPFYLSLGEFVLSLRKAGYRIGVYTIYAKSLKESFKPIRIGDLITKKLSVYEKYEKRDKKYVSWLIEYINQDGELCQRHVRTSYWVGTPQPLLKFDHSGKVVSG